MSQIFTIETDRVVIKKLALEQLDGDLTVAGTLTVDNLVVNNQEQVANTSADFGNWTVSDEVELLGKGLSWTWGEGSVQLMYRTGNRLWVNSDLDIERGKALLIDNTPVLTANELCGQVTKSSLREVGSLKKLNVIGDTTLSEFAFFNSGSARLGLNTDEPNAVLSVVDNDVELVMHSPRPGVGNIGTFTSHDLEIVTDNIPRISIKNNGQITLGSENSPSDVKIYGTLQVDTIVSDTRIDRYSPLEFKTSRTNSIFGQGLIWTGTGGTRQFIMAANPDRLWSSESIDLAHDQSYFINSTLVLSETTLGDNVTKSNLSKVGTLESLTVSGPVIFHGDINATRSVLNTQKILFNDGDEFTITNSKLSSNNSMSISVRSDETYYADTREIILGNASNSRRPIKLFGPVSVGINTPDESVDFAVKGDISFHGKKFVTGTSAPAEGNFRKGDICWNDDPYSGSYVGWVCTAEGSPGHWEPFGAINR